MGSRTPAPRTGLDSPVLVLNRGYQPVRITDARNGFALLYLGRARVLDAYTRAPMAAAYEALYDELCA